MATQQHYVNTASSGGDGTTNATSGATAAFASLASWESNVGAANVATDDYIVDCCGTAADTTKVQINFVNNISTGSITVRANRSDPGGFYDGGAVISTNHYRINAAQSANHDIQLFEANTIIDGIQVISNQTGDQYGGVYVTGTNIANGSVVRKCRLFNNNQAHSGIRAQNIAGTPAYTYQNNLIVNYRIAGIHIQNVGGYSSVHTATHNTIYGDGSSVGISIDRGTVSGTPAFTVKANAIANSGTGADIATSGDRGTLTYADNACEQAAGTTDEIVLGTPANAWTSPGTTMASDFTVKNTSSSLYNAVNPTLLSTDIADFTRDGTNHDVGAFEFQAAGGNAALSTSASACAAGSQLAQIAVALRQAIERMFTTPGFAQA